MSNCSNGSLSQSQKDFSIVLMSSVGLVSILSCLIVICITFCLRLHKHFIYRLAMYQVLSSALVGIDDVLVITLSSYVSENYHTFNHVMCEVTAVLLSYFIWMKLLFTTMLVFHFFSLAVCHKDMKRLELPYILVSLLFPLSFVWVPFINGNYGPAGAWCWIQDLNDDCSHNHLGVAEQYSLWYGPCYLLLTLAMIAVITVIVTLCWRGWCRGKQKDYLLMQSNNRHKKALIEIAPLMAYPIIFFSFNLIATAHRIFNAISDHPSYALELIHSLVNATWGLLSASALFVHILVMQCLKKKAKLESIRDRSSHTGEDQIQNYTSYAEVSTYAKSCYVIPRESEIDGSRENP